MVINFHFQKAASLTQRIKLKAFICSMFKSEKKISSNLSFVFCSDNYLLDINRTFLKHNYYTDIITFNLSLKRDKEIRGEVYISVDRVRENAKIFNNTITLELHRVIFHGILHLCGYEDKTKQQKFKMTQKENFYLNLYRFK